MSVRTKHPTYRCRCGKQLWLTEGRTDLKPGSFTFCAGCGDLLRFGVGLRLARVDAAEIEQMDPVNRAWIRKVQEAIRRMRPN
jgi:hypothetical protein